MLGFTVMFRYDVISYWSKWIQEECICDEYLFLEVRECLTEAAAAVIFYIY